MALDEVLAKVLRDKYLEYLENASRAIDAQDPACTVISMENLSMLNAKRLAPLQVDEAAVGVDSDPRFFNPLFTQDQFTDIRLMAHHWPKDCDCTSDLTVPYVEAMNRYSWAQSAAYRALLLSPWGQNGNHFGSEEPVLNMPTYHYMESGHDDYRFHVESWQYIPSDETQQPHVVSILWDSSTPRDDDVMRSELVSALAMLKVQLYYDDHIAHRILPVLVISFHHGGIARITQVHYDGTLYIRQSRLLDLGGPAPTPDAWLVARWMVNMPIGDTEWHCDMSAEKELLLRDADGEAPPITLTPPTPMGVRLGGK